MYPPRWVGEPNETSKFFSQGAQNLIEVIAESTTICELPRVRRIRLPVLSR